jgi:hypothetical protein
MHNVYPSSAPMSHPSKSVCVSALLLLTVLSSCVGAKVQPTASQCSLRSKINLHNFNRALATVWIVDKTPVDRTKSPLLLESGRHLIGAVSSPLPGWHSYGIIPAELQAGRHYDIIAKHNITTVHQTGVTYEISDRATGEVVASSEGPSLPGPNQQIGSGKSTGLKALEEAMGVEVPVTWPVWLD